MSSTIRSCGLNWQDLGSRLQGPICSSYKASAHCSPQVSVRSEKPSRTSRSTVFFAGPDYNEMLVELRPNLVQQEPEHAHDFCICFAAGSRIDAHEHGTEECGDDPRGV